MWIADIKPSQNLEIKYHKQWEQTIFSIDNIRVLVISSGGID